METDMSEQDKIGTTFVNTVIGRGVLNGVINISFSTFNFTPQDDGKVALDPVVSCRLRMDKICATQLRDVMNDLLALIEKSEQAVPGSAPTEEVKGVTRKQPKEAMN
jgi:hypothetical protein